MATPTTPEAWEAVSELVDLDKIRLTDFIPVDSPFKHFAAPPIGDTFKLPFVWKETIDHVQRADENPLWGSF